MSNAQSQGESRFSVAVVSGSVGVPVTPAEMLAANRRLVAVAWSASSLTVQTMAIESDIRALRNRVVLKRAW